MATASKDAPVAVIGGGVVGCAVALELARRGAEPILLEAEPVLGLAASGTNSGILHTGFDSPPGGLETRLILRSAELRDEVIDALQVPVVRCGALLRPSGAEESDAVAELVLGAARNGVKVNLRDDGTLEVPGESASDPVAFTLALAAAAELSGAQVRTGAKVVAIEKEGPLFLSLADGTRVKCEIAVNCAGLYADEVARMAGDQSFEIYPRKGEFFVFDPPDERPLDRILLPVPSKGTKGVLVFPTIDGKVVAGPTAHDQSDKENWSVRPEAADEVLPKARAMLPSLEGVDPIASYAGLRPAGRGVNYVIGPSDEFPDLINVGAIRSTGLSASLGIAERVGNLVAEQALEYHFEKLSPPAPLPRLSARPPGGPWWRRTAREKVSA